MQNQLVRLDRVKEELTTSGYSAADLARALGISESAVSQFLTGKTRRFRDLPRVADLLGLDIAYLLGTSDERLAAKGESYFEEAAEHLGVALLEEVDIRYGMGATIVDTGNISNRLMPFPRDWLDRLIKGPFEKVFVAHATGDSMQPTLSDGDVVIIDRSQRHLTDQDSVWCIALGELCMIKRIRKLASGGYQINSDNPAVAPMTAHDGEMHIIGRVVWAGRRM